MKRKVTYIICLLSLVLVIFIIVICIRLFDEKKEKEQIDENYYALLNNIEVITHHKVKKGREPLYDNYKYRYYEMEEIFGYDTDVEYLKFNIFIYNTIYKDDIPYDYFFLMHENYDNWTDEQKEKFIKVSYALEGPVVFNATRGILSDMYYAYDDYAEANGEYINGKTEEELVCEDWIDLFNWCIETSDDCWKYRYLRELKKEYIDK